MRPAAPGRKRRFAAAALLATAPLAPQAAQGDLAHLSLEELSGIEITSVSKRGEPLRLRVLVNDRFVEDLAAQLVVRDAGGNTVYQRSGALDLAAAKDRGPGSKEMMLELPALRGAQTQCDMNMVTRLFTVHDLPVAIQPRQSLAVFRRHDEFFNDIMRIKQNINAFQQIVQPFAGNGRDGIGFAVFALFRFKQDILLVLGQFVDLVPYLPYDRIVVQIHALKGF